MAVSIAYDGSKNTYMGFKPRVAAVLLPGIVY